jgi:hypothetical protein
MSVGIGGHMREENLTNITPGRDMDVEITSPHESVDPMNDVTTNQPGNDGQVRHIAANASDGNEHSEQSGTYEGDDRQLKTHICE